MADANKHIFYTDDDEDDQELFRGALTEVDNSKVLTIADDGDTLLQLLESPPPSPQIIFLDLNMPRKNGFEVLEVVRSSAKLKDYPVVVFSTSSDPTAIEKTRQLGANMFVIKPRSYKGIKKAIEVCLNTDWTDFEAKPENYVLRLI